MLQKCPSVKLSISTALIDTLLRWLGTIPTPALHNVEKALMIKRSMWHLNVDGVPGDYVEFGVASGNSLRSAEVFERRSQMKRVGINRIPRKLIGFDSFSEFVSSDATDNHPVWKGSDFSYDIAQVKRRFKRSLGKRIVINQIDAQSLVNGDGSVRIPHERVGLSNQIALLLLDMDLYEPTIAALRWCRTRLQPGTIILCDEYFAFRGRTDRGEARAIEEFLAENSNVGLRIFGYYGSGGIAFIVSGTTNS